MNRPNITYLLLFLFSATLAWSQASAPAKAAAENTVPVSMVVSVEAKHGGEFPVIHQEDVRVLQSKNRLKVTDWVPFQGERAGLELFVLLDEASNPEVGLQFDDLRQFISSQPATTAIAIGYIREGGVEIVQNFKKTMSKPAKRCACRSGSAVFLRAPICLSQTW